MRHYPHTILIAALLLCYAAPGVALCDLKDYRFLTEHSPPFSYTYQGRVIGLAVDRVKKIAELAGCPIHDRQFSLQPWGRAYANALQGPKTAIFSISQTDERRPLFHWVGPIGTGIYGAFGKTTNQQLLTDPLASDNLIWGVVQNDLGEHYAQQLGIDPARLYRAPRPENLVKQLMADRIQLWIYSQNGVIDALTGLGAGPADYTMYLQIQRNDFFLAFSLDTPLRLIGQLQQANQALDASP